MFIFERWKGNQLDAKVMACALISWLDQYRKCNHLIGYISNSNFKFKFSIFQIQNKLLYLPVFVAKRIFKTQHFCFLCFHYRWRFFWFHKDRKITKNLFNLAETNFGERKLSCTHLNFGEILFAGSPGRAVSLHLAHWGSQSEHRIRRIQPARGAFHIIRVVMNITIFILLFVCWCRFFYFLSQYFPIY